MELMPPCRSIQPGKKATLIGFRGVSVFLGWYGMAWHLLWPVWSYGRLCRHCQPISLGNLSFDCAQIVIIINKLCTATTDNAVFVAWTECASRLNLIGIIPIQMTTNWSFTASFFLFSFFPFLRRSNALCSKAYRGHITTDWSFNNDRLIAISGQIDRIWRKIKIGVAILSVKV